MLFNAERQGGASQSSQSQYVRYINIRVLAVNFGRRTGYERNYNDHTL